MSLSWNKNRGNEREKRPKTKNQGSWYLCFDSILTFKKKGKGNSATNTLREDNLGNFFDPFQVNHHTVSLIVQQALQWLQEEDGALISGSHYTTEFLNPHKEQEHDQAEAEAEAESSSSTSSHSIYEGSSDEEVAPKNKRGVLQTRSHSKTEKVERGRNRETKQKGRKADRSISPCSTKLLRLRSNIEFVPPIPEAPEPTGSDALNRYEIVGSKVEVGTLF